MEGPAVFLHHNIILYGCLDRRELHNEASLQIDAEELCMHSTFTSTIHCMPLDKTQEGRYIRDPRKWNKTRNYRTTFEYTKRIRYARNR